MSVRVTATGNLVADPELRFTKSGAPVASFTVASTERYQKDGEWHDAEPVFLRCSVWREQAENVAASMRKGQRVTVTGVLEQRTWETDAGEKRYQIECKVDEVAASLRYAQVRASKVERQKAESGATVTPIGRTGTDGEPPF